MTTVLDCIARIPEKLFVINECREERMQAFMGYVQDRNIKHVIFIASGTSYNSAFTTRLFFESLGLHVSFHYPNMFVHYTKVFDEDALYVVISQGGSTKLVYDALCIVKEKGYANCSITEHLDAPIANVSDIAIEMGSDGEEFLYRTLGYSTTVATCFMLAMCIAEVNTSLKEEQLHIYKEDFNRAIQHLPILREQALTWYQEHKFSLMHKEHMMFSGTADLWPVAQEADIKFMEMIPAITRSFELEEFIHGPQNAFDATSVYFILAQSGQDDDKAISIANFLKQEIGFCCVIGDLARDKRDIYFKPKSTYFTPLEFITILQVLAYKIADDHGRDLGRGVNAQIRNYIKKTL